jgi:peptidoglycan/LPS O-acetylase OafA/YrhL
MTTLVGSTVDAPITAAPPPLGGRDQRDDIQGIRAVAILMIVAYHAGLPLPGSFTGPDVFFVVSGFVITGMLVREWATTGRIAPIRFYSRRVRRLLPALALVSIATVIAAALLFSPIDERQQVTGRAVRSASLFLANFYFLRETGGYFQPDAQKNPFLHTWTLSVEEQFYVVFPLTVALLWWIGRRRGSSSWWVNGVLGLGFLLSLGASVVFSYQWVPHSVRQAVLALAMDPVRLAFFSPLTRGWQFLAGVLLALAAAHWTPAARARSWIAIAGVAILAVAIVGLKPTDVYPGILGAVPVIGTVCLLIGGLGGGPPSLVTRLLSVRPMIWIGDRSYSWYLWHWPFIVFARTLFVGVSRVEALAAVASLIPAALSFRFVEDPIRRRQWWATPRATAWIAATCVAVPLACGLGLRTAADRAWGDRNLATVRMMVTPQHIDITSNCASFSPLADKDRAPCIWPVASSRGTMLLIGDSNAGHLSEPFIAAAHALGYDAQLATAGGCPFLLRPGYPNPSCGEFVEGSVAAIARRTPAYAAIVVSNATVGYLNGLIATQFAADAADVSPSAPTDRPTEIRGWVTSMGRTVTALTRHSPTIVVGAVPQFLDVPGCIRPSLLASSPAWCGRWSPEMAASLRTDIITNERTAVLARGATYVDTGDQLCDPQRGCTAFIDGTLIYRDGAHLSVAGSMHFEPDLEAALAAAIDAHRQR